MTNEIYKSFLENIHIKKNEWVIGEDIESILLKSNIGYYPNWVHLRFLFSDNFILVKHGESKPYGDRLGSCFQLAYDRCSLLFPNNRINVPNNFLQSFRSPKEGDVLIASYGLKDILSESYIKRVVPASNGLSIELMTPITMKESFLLSFYDPKEYNEKICMHATLEPGIYGKFFESSGKKSKYGNFHELIKIKNIKEINLKLRSEKTYKVC